MASISSIFGIKTSNSSSKHHPHVLQSANSSSSSANALTTHSSNTSDDKNFALLKDIASISTNRNCFDCHQRGPTYVNMTIGSFVCTSCSGKLRGLNPPHRVKSISMAVFTNDEVDFLKCRGNEFCQKVWLGRYPGPVLILDKDNDSKLLDNLIARYEKKNWYIHPNESMYEEAKKKNEAEISNRKKGLKDLNKQNSQPQLASLPPAVTTSTSNNSSSSTSATPKQSTVGLSSATIKRPHAATSITSSQQLSSSIFAQSPLKTFSPNTPQSNASLDSPTFAFQATTGFADFTNFSSPPPLYTPPNISNSSKTTSPMTSTLYPQTNQPNGQTFVPSFPNDFSQISLHDTSKQDKYAALHELSNAFDTMNITWDNQGFSNTNPFVSQTNPQHLQMQQLLQQQQNFQHSLDINAQQFYLQQQQQYLQQQQQNLQQQQQLSQHQQQQFVLPQQVVLAKDPQLYPTSFNQIFPQQGINQFHFNNPYIPQSQLVNSGVTGNDVSLNLINPYPSVQNSSQQQMYLFNPSNPFLNQPMAYQKTNPFL